MVGKCHDGSVRALAERITRAIARLVSFGWFRVVEADGLERIPRSGAVILAANHHGGFVDPALLMAVSPRPVRFLAMARLWRIVPLRPLLALAGAIPVQRARDGATESNVQAFAACFEVLRDGGVIGIFPEGEASDAVHVLPARTGTARIALGARAAGVRGSRIVPVGLIYEDKQDARSRAYVRVGEPIDVDAVGPGDAADRSLVASLTGEIDRRLAAAAVDYESAGEQIALRFAAKVTLRWKGADPRGRPPIGEVERLADRLGRSSERIVPASVAYMEALRAAGVPDDVVAPGAIETYRRRGRPGWLAALVLSPFAVVGLVFNAVPMIGLSAVGRRPMSPVTRATAKLLTALVLFSANWVIVRHVVFGDGSRPWLSTLVVGPVCGLAAIWWVARWIRARRARLGVGRLVGEHQLLSELQRRRQAVVESVTAIVGDAEFAARRPRPSTTIEEFDYLR
jgi:1-acyl-sn-glycerol-3-phosphate acyltransferase